MAFERNRGAGRRRRVTHAHSRHFRRFLENPNLRRIRSRDGIVDSLGTALVGMAHHQIRIERIAVSRPTAVRPSDPPQSNSNLLADPPGNHSAVLLPPLPHRRGHSQACREADHRRSSPKLTTRAEQLNPGRMAMRNFWPLVVMAIMCLATAAKAAAASDNSGHYL